MIDRLAQIKLLCSILVTVTCCISARVRGDGTWSRFHGADGAGYVSKGKIPDSWSASDYKWVAELGARDVGSPSVQGDRAYVLVSKPESQQISVQCYGLGDGDLVWERDYPLAEHHLHSRNTFASGTPTIADDRLLVAWSEPEHTILKCLDLSGQELWSRDFGSWQSQHGFGTSPRVFDGAVLLLNSQQGEQLRPGQIAGRSRMISVDLETGKTRWETPLKTTRSCYGVPAIHRNSKGQAVIVAANTGNGMFGLNPSDGKMLWSKQVFEMRCCSTPVIFGNLAIGSSGSGGGGNHLVAVQIPDTAGVQPEQVYRIDRGAPYVPTPALKDGLMFTVSDKGGIASCMDAETGKTHWSKRLGGNFGASPIVIGNKVLLISLDGTATVLSATKSYKKLGQFDLGGPVGATPAYQDGKLLLRIDQKLCCLSTGS